MTLYYNRSGASITMERWAKLHATRRYVVVTQTRFECGGMLSTIWLGLDHSGLVGGGPPLIFETQAFDIGVEIQARYATEEEARAGHREWLKLARADGSKIKLDFAAKMRIKRAAKGM